MDNDKFDDRDESSQYSSTHLVRNKLKSAISMEYSKVSKNRDKKDFATTQQVFDKKTLKIINKFIVNNIFTKLEDCISTGKEAVVFNASDPSGEISYAVKVYKTMVMDFKDREEYISGEYRFRHKGKGTRTNPHKLIRDWAEKEFRNYKRLQTAGLNCPKAIQLKHNVLVMELIGEKGKVAKRLRDTPLSTEQLCEVYIDVIKIMRNMFIKAKLVHGDLSEFNLLYHNEQVVVIDVSQSVEDNHPMAIEFFKRDIYNINEYFKKNGVIVFKLRDIFNFATDTNLKNEGEEERIHEMIDSVKDMDGEYVDHDAEIFMGVNIPRSLHDIDLYTMEKHIFQEKKVGDQLYSNLTGLAAIKEKSEKEDKEVEEDGVEEGDDGEGGDDDEEDDEDDNSEDDSDDDSEDLKEDMAGLGLEEVEIGEDGNPIVKRKKEGPVEPEETAEEKRLRKAQVKEEKREKRKTKVPKKVKKRMDKLRKNVKIR